jgi:tricorn protease
MLVTALPLVIASVLAAPGPTAVAAAPVDPPVARPMFQPAIAPDRPEIVFVSGGDLWTAPLAGGEGRLLVSHPATESRPLYAPDGKSLAFVSTRTGNGDIYVLGLESGALRRVTFGDTADLLDAWSPDGQYLYFTGSAGEVGGRTNIHRVRAAGGTPMPVVDERYVSEYWAAPAPKGDALALTAKGIVNNQWWRNGHSHIDESEIWVRRGGATVRYDAVTRGGAKSAWPMWSADGTRLFYMSDRSGAENIWEQPIGGTAKPITTFTKGRVLWPSISVDGKSIVFERDLGLWRLDVATGKAAPVAVTLRGAPAGDGTQRLTLQNRFSDLALSPDGRKVAFVARGEVFAAASKEGDPSERLTRTAAAESDPTWAPDSRRLAYVSARDGQYQIYLYDFSTRTESRLTQDPAGSHLPRWSPDGKQIAYLRGRERLMVIDVATRTERQLATGEFGLPPLGGGRPFAWSPDGAWLAYYAVGARRFTNVHLVPAGGGTGRPVSFVSNAFGNIVTWSPDGKFLLFDTAQRTENNAVARVDLLKRTPRFREDQFRDLFREEVTRPSSPAIPATTPTRPPTPDPANPTPAPPPSPTPGPTTAPPAAPSTPETPSRGAGAPAATAAPARPATPPVKVEVVWDDIRRRLGFLPVGLSVNEHAITPDGKTLVLTATVAGQTNLYTYSLDELAREAPVARQVTSTPGGKSGLQIAPDGKEVYYLEQGRIASVTLESRAVRQVAVTADLEVRFDRERQVVFDEAWTYLRDWFYDPAFHGADWNGLRTTYAPYVAGSANADELRRVLSLMIGELNASHLGINGPPDPGAITITGRTGLQFDRDEYERSGRLRLASVLPLGPADVAGGFKPGQYLVSVDGTAIDRDTSLDELLQFKVNRRTTLRVADRPDGSGGKDIAVLPANTTTEAALTYRQWVEERRAFVDKTSNGRLGYVHIRDMGQESLTQLFVDLDTENQARDGVVIDIRNNNGGFVNAYALDVFTRKPYLNMTYRGSAITAPARAVLGQRSLEKPTILVTNHASLSDAEDFTEGHRTLGVGKVVGEPTSGWIIYTTNTGLTDGSVLRVPFIKITTAAGVNMERAPRPVDVPVDLALGEEAAGRDGQLERAVKELLADLGGSKTTAAAAR